MLAFTMGMDFENETVLLGIHPKEIVRHYQRLQYKNIHHSEE